MRVKWILETPVSRKQYISTAAANEASEIKLNQHQQFQQKLNIIAFVYLLGLQETASGRIKSVRKARKINQYDL